MPATERAFTEFPPTKLYLDTDFVLTYLVKTRPHHAKAESFGLHLFKIGITAVYASPLLWLEYGHTVRRADFRDALPQELKAKYDLAHWADTANVRQAYLEAMLFLLERFLAHFTVVEVPLTEVVRVEALRLMTLYNLGAQDAVHLASAQQTNVLDLASFDRTFRRVDGLYLWNDHIFSHEPVSAP